MLTPYEPSWSLRSSAGPSLTFLKLRLKFKGDCVFATRTPRLCSNLLEEIDLWLLCALFYIFFSLGAFDALILFICCHLLPLSLSLLLSFINLLFHVFILLFFLNWALFEESVMFELTLASWVSCSRFSLPLVILWEKSFNSSTISDRIAVNE